MGSYKLTDDEVREVINWKDIEKFIAPERCGYGMKFTDIQKNFLIYFFRIRPRKERARIGAKLFPGVKFRTLTRYVAEWEIEGRFECVR